MAYYTPGTWKEKRAVDVVVTRTDALAQARSKNGREKASYTHTPTLLLNPLATPRTMECATVSLAASDAIGPTRSPCAVQLEFVEQARLDGWGVVKVAAQNAYVMRSSHTRHRRSGVAQLLHSYLRRRRHTVRSPSAG